MPLNEPDDFLCIICAAETSNLDPVCSLSTANKLRLCSILYGSTEFKNAVVGTFVPVLDNVQQQCDRKMVSLHLLSWSIRRQYEEWVIGCVTNTSTNGWITYYVSRGKERNTIFVYLADMGRQIIALHNFFYNVSVVDRLYQYSNEDNSTIDALV